MKDHLQKHVSQFVAELKHILLVYGIHRFVCFFNQIFAQALVSLFQIPGAAVLSAQPAHNLDKLPEAIALAFLKGNRRQIRACGVAVKILRLPVHLKERD